MLMVLIEVSLGLVYVGAYGEEQVKSVLVERVAENEEQEMVDETDSRVVQLAL